MSSYYNGNDHINPFPAAAVVKLSNGSNELLTIETPALKRFRAEIYEYLIREDDNGKTICVIGEYGTGKTHEDSY